MAIKKSLFIYPMEVAAGMDVVALRTQYGRDLIIGGGMDKRVLASTQAAIRDVVEEKMPLLREGGYVPGCDHAMPQDIPWENHLYDPLQRDRLVRQHLGGVPEPAEGGGGTQFRFSWNWTESTTGINGRVRSGQPADREHLPRRQAFG